VQTDCNPQSITFTPLDRRQLLAQFNGKPITSDAGALLLREVAARSKLFERIAATAPDPRDPDLIEHDQQTMLAQCVLGMACGWEDLNDHHGPRTDPLMQVATERDFNEDRSLASSSNITRKSLRPPKEPRSRAATPARESADMLHLALASARS
jgi:hypothetical protein